MPGKGKSRKSILSAIESLMKRIEEHERKIANAHEIEDRYNIEHWRKEIKEFKNQVSKLQQEARVATDD
jgi:prefoldin subunit 5